MNTLYKGRYTYLLLGPNYAPSDVETFQDMMDRNLYVSFAPFRKYAIISAFPEFENYTNSLILDPEKIDSLDMVAFQKNAAILMSYDQVKYIEKNYTDAEGRSLLQLVHPLKLNLLIGSVFLKNNTHFCRLNRYLSLLHEHGFEENIMSKYKLSDHDKESRRVKKQRHEKIEMKHLVGPFALLIFGLLLATLNLFVEILMKRM
ncbi:hypothetical protein HHI36_012595 [Cryptolaemus montrouzieri]|uniref:Uncharacterized protein n=1 Tax=Cryptolaemus montrouzieri TaxID=559131 RepID=A0ABD2NF64_9CUCU